MIWKTCGATPNGFRSKVSKMQVLQENSIATLEVLRASDMGVFLNGGTGNTNDKISRPKRSISAIRSRSSCITTRRAA